MIYAVDIPREDRLRKYSDPEKAQEKTEKYLGKGKKLYKSFRTGKKYMVLDNNGDWIHFGAMGYEDFTRHQDKERRRRYRARASKIKGKWKKNKFSPNNLSIHILW